MSEASRQQTEGTLNPLYDNAPKQTRMVRHPDGSREAVPTYSRTVPPEQSTRRLQEMADQEAADQAEREAQAEREQNQAEFSQFLAESLCS